MRGRYSPFRKQWFIDGCVSKKQGLSCLGSSLMVELGSHPYSHSLQFHLVLTHLTNFSLKMLLTPSFSITTVIFYYSKLVCIPFGNGYAIDSITECSFHDAMYATVSEDIILRVGRSNSSKIYLV